VSNFRYCGSDGIIMQFSITIIPTYSVTQIIAHGLELKYLPSLVKDGKI
jgi:hypothetical protein